MPLGLRIDREIDAVLGVGAKKAKICRVWAVEDNFHICTIKMLGMLIPRAIECEKEAGACFQRPFDANTSADPDCAINSLADSHSQLVASL